jgi:hypothetical protein
LLFAVFFCGSKQALFLSTRKRLVHSHARAEKTLEAFVLSALVLFVFYLFVCNCAAAT